ncbi:hypothetical protein B0H15DRAFT_832783 [Mycena belliarum]|uniref:Uncharacterized protein n=1 Tax=Mycena belliarum TaxID=1033014 RepID=A0AAD6U9Y0_9AGAR|nr:hypothetical protein B0H15DRAFT_832783 [Mycena belliae]
MHFLPTAFLISTLVQCHIALAHAAPCDFGAAYSMLETGGRVPAGRGCKYVPAACRGLPEQLLPVRNTLRPTPDPDTDGRISAVLENFHDSGVIIL